MVAAGVSADDKPQPKYAPGFDCSAVAAGSHRQACNRSQLKPPMGTAPETTRSKPQGIVPQVKPQRLPTAQPPTIPRLPGTIDQN